MTNTISRWVTGGQHVTTAIEHLKIALEELESQGNLQETTGTADFFYAQVQELRLMIWDLQSVNKGK